MEHEELMHKLKPYIKSYIKEGIKGTIWLQDEKFANTYCSCVDELVNGKYVGLPNLIIAQHNLMDFIETVFPSIKIKESNKEYFGCVLDKEHLLKMPGFEYWLNKTLRKEFDQNRENLDLELFRYATHLRGCR